MFRKHWRKEQSELDDADRFHGIVRKQGDSAPSSEHDRTESLVQ